MRYVRRRLKRSWRRFKKMWRSQTLPRPRPLESGPPLPPRNLTGTLSRQREVDVQRLREDIDTLSRQLRMVRAQLCAQIKDDVRRDERLREERREERQSYPRDDSPDSRLSTALFSPVSTRNTPTPLPTKGIVCSEESPRNSTMRRNSCFPSTAAKEIYQQSSTVSMMSVTVPSASIFVPRVKRRETFSKADMKSSYARRASLQSVRAASDSVGTFPPPKPVRTFVETLDSLLQRRTHTERPLVNTRTKYEIHPVSQIAEVNGEDLAKLLCDKFEQGHCWFVRDDDVFFVNPFSNISGENNHEPYPAIGNLVDELLMRPMSALVFRGLSGSGKSNLAEMALYETARKLHVNGSAMAVVMAAMTALRPLTTINSKRNNLSSRSVHHTEIHHRHGMISKIRFKHFLLEAPSRSSRANIFAMLASELKEADKDRYRLTGFHLREEYANYGNLEDFKSALSTLGISVQDVFSVVSAITLMNNLCFKELNNYVDIENIADLEDAAHLLGVSSLSLYRTILNGSASETTITQTQKIRDELGAAIFSRLIFLVISRANRMLESIYDVPESMSSFNDSGISVGSTRQNSILRIVDVPGYSKATTNSLTELLINTINDSLDGKQSKEAKKLLEKIEAVQENKSVLNRATYLVKHADGGFPIEYELGKMVQKNQNIISKEIIRLFDTRCCSCNFVNKLFLTDLDRLLADTAGTFYPKAVIFQKEDTTIIQSVLAFATDLQNQMDDCEIKIVHCIKSNDKLEYSRINEDLVLEQLYLIQNPITSSQLSLSVLSPGVMQPPESEFPAQPPPRNYELREGRLHKFPQRRNMVVDHIDHSTGVTIAAGEVVKALGFKGECYVIETGRGIQAKVPISFTEKSLPPTEGYHI